MTHDTDPPYGCPASPDGLCKLHPLARAVGTLTDRINELSPRLEALEPKIARIVQVTTVLEARYPFLTAANDATLDQALRAKLTATEALALARQAGRRSAAKWSLPGIAAAVAAVVLELLR